MLMRLLADLYVGRENKIDDTYLDRKIERQKKIVREFDCPAVRQYLSTHYGNQGLDVDLAEELDWLLSIGAMIAHEMHENCTF